MTDRLRIALAQYNFCVGDITGNTAKICAAVKMARDKLGADVVAFPELAITGYPPEDLLFRPGLHRRVSAALDHIASAAHDIHAVVGYPRRRDDTTFNAVSVLRDGVVVFTYHKQRLPNYLVFDEQRYFVAGSDAGVVELSGFRIALSICEDIWDPATAAQATAAGAEMILNINASPYNANKRSERITALKTACAAAQLPIVYLNIVGGQDELVFDGGSLVMDACGAVPVQGPEFVETLLPLEVMRTPCTGLSFTGPLTEPLSAEENIYQALLLGVRDYVEKNGFKGVVLGLSGGIDSALTLAIAVDALGAERVVAVSMPSRYTAEMSVADALEQARRQGCECHVVPIEDPFKAFNEVLTPIFADAPVDVTEENIQARCRGIILMAISNKTGRMVLATGNKSEMAVGYATLYGDMAGGFAPLKDVPKTLVYRLARWRNRDTEVIPHRVLERAPSAELAPDQKDTDSLPDYAVLDPILEYYIECDETPREIAARGFDIELVRRVARLVDRNEYKRRQAAPGVRITKRAFGRDRRFPITSRYDEQQPTR